MALRGAKLLAKEYRIVRPATAEQLLVPSSTVVWNTGMARGIQEVVPYAEELVVRYVVSVVSTGRARTPYSTRSLKLVLAPRPRSSLSQISTQQHETRNLYENSTDMYVKISTDGQV
jgi:hypothetical protein